MDEIVVELDVSEESWAVKTVKQQMTAWANEIPHHPYENLGDLIHIDTIHYRPSYVISLQTQYEMRDKRSTEEPYYGTSIPPLRYTSLSQVNEWSTNLGKKPDFTDSDNWYYVQGSQKVSQCSTCGGRGRTTCSSCSGTGIVTCSKCMGAGTTNCWKCSGTGNERKSCSTCGGSGSKWNPTLQRNEQCYSCSGKGTWLERCWSCNGTGREKCTSCSGTGRVSCSSCSGKGYNTCWSCSGQGRVMESFQVRQILTAQQKIISLNHDKVKNDFPHFSINSEKNKGEVVLTLDESTLKPSELDNWPPLTAVFKEMHQ
jgi:hypothetical protein